MKGNVLDAAAIVVMLFIIGVTVILGYMLVGEFQQTSLNNTATGAAALQKSQDAMQVFDYLIPLMVFGSGAASVVSAYFVRSHPALFAISVIALIIVVIFSASLANVFIDVTTGTALNASAQHFPITFMVWQNLPMSVAVFGTLITVALVAKSMQG